MEKDEKSAVYAGGRIGADERQHYSSPGCAGPQLVGVPEASRRLAIGERAAWRLVATGELPSVRIGRRRLVSLDDIAAFIAARREGGER